MNPRIIKTVILSTSLALPAGLYAQSQGAGSSAQDPIRPSTGQTQQRPAISTPSSQQPSRYGSESGEIKRVSSEQLEQKVTAKKLLDKDVYDQAGEKVGTVTDFALGSALPAQLAQKMESNLDADRPATTSSSMSSTRPSTSQSGSSSAGQVSQTSRSTSQTAQAGQTQPGRTSMPSTSSPTRTGSVSSTSTLSSLDREQELILFVQVGGALGMGGDTVAIPASELDYDSEEDRFTIAKSREEIAAIAEGSDETQGAAKQRFED